MRYYAVESHRVYDQVERDHLTQWNDVFDPGGAASLEKFAARAFLERVLPSLMVPADVLEYGCGTGLASCFLAARGCDVTGVDIDPRAIELAKSFAERLGVHLEFAVKDICAWPADDSGRRYDIVLDSFCLQSVVLDEDRTRLFDAVRRRLRPDGHYLLLTAMYEPDREYGETFRYDENSGICMTRVADGSADRAQWMDGGWFQPYRRHLRPERLRAELEHNGFRVLSQRGGELVCTVDR